MAWQATALWSPMLVPLDRGLWVVDARMPLADRQELTDDAPLAPDDVEQVLIAGHRNYETLFLHKATRTLVVTDLVYNARVATCAMMPAGQEDDR
jgi:hypothetical protein